MLCSLAIYNADDSDHFSLSRGLQPKDNLTATYTITASFEDSVTQPLNATA
jgi:hypothetical protein